MKASEVSLFRTDERSVRIKTGSGVIVDGVVQVRHFGLNLASAKIGLEHHDPVAVVVERNGRIDRIPLVSGQQAPGWIAWLALPLIAGMASRALGGRRKKER
jgi:hypothetical protein